MDFIVIIIVAIIHVLCLLPLSIWAFTKKTPMHFWAGDDGKIKPEELTDVKAYNRANGWLWLWSSLLLGIAALMIGLPMPFGLLLYAFVYVVGFFLLPKSWVRILERYKVK